MKASPAKIIAASFAFVLAFLFLLPVVGYASTLGVYNCPANGCTFVHYGPVTHWAMGFGGVLEYNDEYTISAVSAPATYSVSTSVSYTVSVQPSSTATTATDPMNGLELRLFLNTSSSSATGVSVRVFVDAYNPSTSTANVASASDWVVPLNYTDGAPCGDDTYAQNPTVGFAIAQGYYTSSNVTEAKFLDLVNPNAFYNCPLYLGYANPTGFLFQPMNDTASSYGCDQSWCMSGSASTGLLTSSSLAPGTGYWTQGGAFISFSKGTYTVLAEDQWGALALAYFNVS